MSIVSTQAYLLTEVDDVPARFTRILHDSIARLDGAVVTASSTADEPSAFPEAPVSDQTWEWWKADELPATWEVDAGEPVDVNAVGLAVHDAGDRDVTFEIEHSDDGSTWTAVPSTAINPGNNAPLMWLFDTITDRYWRLRITGDTAPRIGVLQFGKALAMIRPTRWNGHTPIALSRDTQQRANFSERQERLGKTLIGQGYEGSFEAHNLDEDWVRAEVDKFIKAAQRYGYFIAWRPTQFPDEVFFAWTDDDIRPNNSQGGGTRRMTVQWNIRAHGGYEIGEAPWKA